MPRRESLFQFFGGCFHEDWAVDDREWPDVVARFRADVGAATCETVADELRKLLISVDDEALQTIVWRQLGCYYDPRPDLGGPTLREWLQQVAAQLRAA